MDVLTLTSLILEILIIVQYLCSIALVVFNRRLNGITTSLGLVFTAEAMYRTRYAVALSLSLMSADSQGQHFSIGNDWQVVAGILLRTIVLIANFYLFMVIRRYASKLVKEKKDASTNQALCN